MCACTPIEVLYIAKHDAWQNPVSVQYRLYLDLSAIRTPAPHTLLTVKMVFGAESLFTFFFIIQPDRRSRHFCYGGFYISLSFVHLVHGLSYYTAKAFTNLSKNPINSALPDSRYRLPFHPSAGPWCAGRIIVRRIIVRHAYRLSPCTRHRAS